ncbi:MAG: glycoside hydrolase family 97 N-terminal domain-containing protein, partial [bacterium]
MRDHHEEVRVRVAERAGLRRTFSVIFRAFDDGVAFRYDLPAQPNLTAFAISDELTEFVMADNPKTWWIPANRKAMDRYEFLHGSSPLSLVDSVRTPLTMEIQGGPVVVLHEAHLEDYAAMDLARVGERTLRPALS